ncbi:condensation domain-containing protein [Dictyobacter vulcani]|uniref:condensation domain-containing protein n=1 Tax=Dictyobacter vulcani TaxID=2607529 RepID=UPI001386BA8F
MQQGLLFHSLYEPVGGDHIIQTCFSIDGPLNVEAFVQAWQQVSARHGVLRTGFIWRDYRSRCRLCRARQRFQSSVWTGRLTRWKSSKQNWPSI